MPAGPSPSETDDHVDVANRRYHRDGGTGASVKVPSSVSGSLIGGMGGGLAVDGRMIDLIGDLRADEQPGQ
jgi:hypothetical protein